MSVQSKRILVTTECGCTLMFRDVVAASEVLKVKPELLLVTVTPRNGMYNEKSLVCTSHGKYTVELKDDAYFNKYKESVKDRFSAFARRYFGTNETEKLTKKLNVW